MEAAEMLNSSDGLYKKEIGVDALSHSVPASACNKNPRNKGIMEFIMDVRLNLISADSSCSEILGYSVKELQGMPLSNLSPAKDTRRWNRHIKGALNAYQQSGKRIFTYKTGVITKGGKLIYLELWLKLLADENDNIYAVVAMGKDITESKRLEVNRRVYIKKQKELISSRDNFFSIIANDLKSPLLSMVGFTDMLVTQYDFLSDPERMVFINEIKNSTNKAYELLYNLLMWTKTRPEKKELSPSVINICEVFEKCLSIPAMADFDKKPKIINAIPENLYVFAEEFMFNTAVKEMLSVVLKSCDEDEDLLFDARGTGNRVEINIRYYNKEIKGADSKGHTDERRGKSAVEFEKNLSNTLRIILAKEFIIKNNGNFKEISEKGGRSLISFNLPRA